VNRNNKKLPKERYILSLKEARVGVVKTDQQGGWGGGLDVQEPFLNQWGGTQQTKVRRAIVRKGREAKR